MDTMSAKSILMFCLLYMPLLNAVVLSFFHESDNVTFGLQYGPIIIAWIIIFIISLFEDDNKVYKEIIPIDPRTLSLCMLAAIIIILIILHIAVGAPEISFLDFTEIKFWIAVVLIPLFSSIRYIIRAENHP